MPAPSVPPGQRLPSDMIAPDAYSPGQLIWVYRGTWRPGVILAVSAGAAMVRYRPHAGRGTGVDTALAADIAVRCEPDPVLDGPPPGPQPRRGAALSGVSTLNVLPRRLLC